MEQGMSNGQKAGTERPLRNYVAPKLSVYGAVSSLTAAGSMGSAEGSMMTDLTRRV